MRFRYPGIQSFTHNDKSLFFGRDREVKELFRLIVLNDLVILFGKSGIGKTSLLQAGVGTLLEERLLHPVKIRLNNIHQPISRQLYEQFNEAELLPVNTSDELSLWEYCQQLLYVSGGEVHTPVLVLDQFEELFTLYHSKVEVQQDFIAQLSAVVNQLAPQHLIKPEWELADRERFLTPPKVHIVISIRSDFLYLLDRLSNRIPYILRCRYELNTLNEKNARIAITRPALLAQFSNENEPGDKTIAFTAAQFSYSNAALDDIIDNLTLINDPADWPNKNKTRSEVEAFQLQLLCRYIEDKIIAEKCPTGFEIFPDFYGGKLGIETILRAFYSSVLDKFDVQLRPKIQRLVEEKLLSDDRRILQEKEFLKRECQIGDAELVILTRERLLKEEPRGGSFYYEISHDTLVLPIIIARDKRLQQEHQEQQERERLETEQRIKDAEAKVILETERREEAEKLKRKAERGRTLALWFAFVAFLTALLVILLWGWLERKNEELKLEKDKLEKTNRTLGLTLDTLNKEKMKRDAMEAKEADKVYNEVQELIKTANMLQQCCSYEAKKKREEIDKMLDKYRENERIQSLRKKLNL